MSNRELYLGTSLETAERVTLDMDHLATHAVCVGMTGSGKTGLGVVALEELARRGVSLLIVDLKGDMVDLLLNFPSLDAAAFAPWLPPDATGEDADAGAQAARWRRGLEDAGLGPEDMRAVRDGVRWQLLTPGWASGAPLDILPSLGAPTELGPDAVTDRAGGVTSALLSLIGRGGDPLADRDHVLTSSVILEHWRRGESLDLHALLRSLADPPMGSMGALPMDTFYPRADRMNLVMSVNTLLASPAFAAWTEGVPMDMEHLLGRAGDPRASIISVAHLDEHERRFVISLLASELVAWMRAQPASSGLRALLYMDEVQGLVPPHPHNPPTKAPLLTLFKQGRAYGVGAWLATQNPVDLDYKALGNAGVKVIGRLVTDRDRGRALEGLGMTRLADGRDAEDVVARLGKRQFLLTDVRAKEEVRTFSSRWAMSYLRGPVTVAEMKPLFGAIADVEAAPPAASGEATGAAQPPPMAAQVAMRFAPDGQGTARPAVLVRARVVVEQASLDLHRAEDELWLAPVDGDGRIRWQDSESLAALPELTERPPAGMTFPAAAPGGLSGEIEKAHAAFVTWRARQAATVLVNERLKLAARVGEDHDSFLERCLREADTADDASQERIKKRYQGRMATVRRRLERERDELERDRTQLRARTAEERMGIVEGLFSVLLGSKSLRSASRKAASRARTAAGKRRMRQNAEGAVLESENEIERLDAEIEALAGELQDEIDRIAAASEEKAEAIEEKPFKPKKADVAVLDVWLVWG